MARTTTTCTASCSGCPPRRSRRSPKRASSERVLRQELFDTKLCCRQRRACLPLPDELAVGEQLRRQQADDERSTDALAVQVAPVDTQVVEQGDVVGGVGVPAVLCGDGSAGLAAGIALIHRDHPEGCRELGGGVDGSGGAAPDLDDRLQARGREREDGKPLAELLVVDGRTVVFKGWHSGVLSCLVAPTRKSR